MSKHTPGPWYQNKANPLVICAPDGFADPWYVDDVLREFLEGAAFDATKKGY